MKHLVLTGCAAALVEYTAMYTAKRAREPRPSRAVALRGLAGAAVALALCLTAGGAHARSGKGDYIGGWSVSGGLVYAIPNTDEYGDALTWRLGVGYNPMPPFEIGLELSRFSSAVSQPESDGVPTHDIASGRLEVLPVCLTVRYHIPLSESMSTFNLLAGAGYYFISYSMADEQRAFFESQGVEGLPDQHVRDTWGFHAGAGLEYAFNAWFSVIFEGRYVFLAPSVSGTAKDDHLIGGSLDLNTWLFTGGIKVAF